MMLRNVVVLPAPLRPTRQTSSPAATFRLMSVRMRLPSISTLRFDKLSIMTAFLKSIQSLTSKPQLKALPQKPWAYPHDGSDHRRVGEEDIRLHISEQRAALQRDDTMRVPLNEVHIVFDLDDGTHTGRPGGGDEHFHDRMLVATRDAAGRLVQQNNGGIERKGAGDIEQFLLALRQCRSHDVELGAQAQHLSDALDVGLKHGIACERAKWIGSAAQTRCDRDRQRLPHRKSGKDVVQLKCARHS